MNRSNLLWLPCLGLAASLFNACGGVNNDLFSEDGGRPSGSAGESAQAGRIGSGGASAVAGSTSQAGESSGGSVEAGGSGSEGGSSAAGSPADAGAPNGGSPGSGGTSNVAGSGGSVAGSTSTAGGGSGGGSSEPTCQELFARAEKELAAAQTCNVAADAKQCTGKVESTCGCQVPVQRGDSPESKTYEDTLKQIDKQNCHQVCPALACVPVNFAQCKGNGGGVVGTCTSYGFNQD